MHIYLLIKVNKCTESIYKVLLIKTLTVSICPCLSKGLRTKSPDNHSSLSRTFGFTTTFILQ